MDKPDIELLFEYDRWANRRVLEAASTLSDDQFTRDLGGPFPSVRNTMLHIAGGEWIWLQYWKAPADSRSPGLIAEAKQRQVALFQPEKFPSCAAVQAKWSE